MPGRDGNPRRQIPPVVKIIIYLLGFENIGTLEQVAAPQGQPTLKDMLWKGPDASPSKVSRYTRGDRGDSELTSYGTSDKTTARPVQASPPAPVPRSPILSTLPVANDLSLKSREQGRGGSKNPAQVAAGSILVHCPRCKACLPLGEAWDRHREEHLHTQKASPKSVVRQQIKASSTSTAFPSETKISDGLWRERMTLPQQNPPRSFDAERDLATNRNTCTRQVKRAVRAPPPHSTAGEGRSGEAASKRARLSDLFHQAVTPERAADVLKELRLLKEDGQTRFAHLFSTREDTGRRSSSG